MSPKRTVWLETKEVCWDFCFQYISMQVTDLRAPFYSLPDITSCYLPAQNPLSMKHQLCHHLSAVSQNLVNKWELPIQYGVFH